MLEKKFSCYVEGIPPSAKVEGSKLSKNDANISFLPDGNILITAKSGLGYNFYVYGEFGLLNRFNVSGQYGRLINTVYHRNSLWIEFEKKEDAYTEYLNIVKANHLQIELVACFPRESYSHNLLYHRLFTHDDKLFLNLIRYNRLHQYEVGGANLKDTCITGGNWYLFGSCAMCDTGELEFYDQFLENIFGLEKELSIDNIISAGGHIVNDPLQVFAIVDNKRMLSTIYFFDENFLTLEESYIEHPVRMLGIGGSRVWVNPFINEDGKEIGGCVVFDRQGMLLYSHMCSKFGDDLFGAYPPPFLKAYRIYDAGGGTTAVECLNRVLFLDSNARILHKLNIAPNSVTAACESLGQLGVFTRSEEQDGSVLDVYSLENIGKTGNIVDMSNFHH